MKRKYKNKAYDNMTYSLNELKNNKGIKTDKPNYMDKKGNVRTDCYAKKRYFKSLVYI